jgi:hypothetical protein
MWSQVMFKFLTLRELRAMNWQDWLMNVVFEIGVGDVSLVSNVKTSRMIAGQCGPTLC